MGFQESFAAGLEAGHRQVQLRQQAQISADKRASEEEDRKLRIQLAQHQLRGLKLEAALKAREAAGQEFGRLTTAGVPGAEVSLPGIADPELNLNLPAATLKTPTVQEAADKKKAIEDAARAARVQPVDPALRAVLQRTLGSPVGNAMDPETLQALVSLANNLNSERGKDRRDNGPGNGSMGTPVMMQDPTTGQVQFVFPKLLASGAGNGAVVAAPDGLQKPASDADVKARSELISMVEDANMIESLLPEVEGSIGPIGGRLGTLRSATVGSTPSLVTVQQMTANISDQLLRARSGAAISETEMKRMLKMVPAVNDPLPTFKTKLANFKSELSRLLARRQARNPSAAAPTALKVGDELAPGVTLTGIK